MIYFVVSVYLLCLSIHYDILGKKGYKRTHYKVAVALLVYAALFLLSPLVAAFYGEPLLEDLLAWLALVFVINAFRTVQQARLNIAMDFRRQAWISVASVSASGCAGMWMARHGFGVWTLVWQPLLQNFLNVALLWISAGWMPSLVFPGVLSGSCSGSARGC